MALPLGHDTIVVCCKHEHQKQCGHTAIFANFPEKIYTISPFFLCLILIS